MSDKEELLEAAEGVKKAISKFCRISVRMNKCNDGDCEFYNKCKGAR